MTGIPFELHLTIDDPGPDRLDAFAAWCRQQGAKPIIIELARGAVTQQPMLGKVVYSANLQEALATAEALSDALQTAGFIGKRIKIEIPAYCAAQIEPSANGFTPYYEWHAKVPYIDPERLLNIALEHGAHLSRNAISGVSGSRFVTLREYGAFHTFQERTAALQSALLLGGWEILKLESEYCIYDSDISLDRGWLPQ